jgi:hypothetical protein
MTVLSRRELAAAALASVVSRAAQAQAPDLLQAARNSKRQAAEDLAKFEPGMLVEPAFQFKA